MQFRHLGDGRTFPPIAPNGRVFAAPIGLTNEVEVFCLTPRGIVGGGIQSKWSEIVGFYYDDDFWEIILSNYIGRGMRFRQGSPCTMIAEGAHQTVTTSIQGYSIPFCVMNRIAFEQNYQRCNLGNPSRE